MKISNLYQLQTESNTATAEEIATVVVNLNRGLKLQEIKIIDDKIHFIFKGESFTALEGAGGGSDGA